MIEIKVKENIGIIYTMQMKDKEDILCEGTISIGDPCEILSMTVPDINMGKALLNLAYTMEKKTVICKSPLLFDLMDKLRFTKEENYAILSLEGYFSSKCKNI